MRLEILFRMKTQGLKLFTKQNFENNDKERSSRIFLA